MTCNKCGQENYEMSKFCIGCGAPLEEAAPMQETVVLPTVETVEAPVYEAVPPVMQPQEASVQENPYYQPYQPPVQNTPYFQPPVVPQNNGETPVSFGKWMGIMALEIFLSFVYLIMLFVWAFSSGTEASLKNYARARLLWTAIGVGLVVLFFVLMFVIAGVGLADVADEIMYY